MHLCIKLFFMSLQGDQTHSTQTLPHNGIPSCFFSRNGRHWPSRPPPLCCCSYPGRLRCAAIEATDQSGVSREMCGSKYERVSLSPFEWSMHGTCFGRGRECRGRGEGKGEGEGRRGLD